MERFSTIFGKVREQSGVWFSNVFIVLFLFFVAGGGISHNGRWRVDRVDILNNSAVSADEIRSFVNQKLAGNYYFVYARDNSYLFPKSEIEQSVLNAFPRLASVSAFRTNDHTISVSVTERKPYALWCGEQVNDRQVQRENCWFFDNNGFVFDKAPVFSKGVYIEVYVKLIEKNIGEALRATFPYDRFTVANTFAKLVSSSVGKLFLIALKPEGEIEVTIHSSAQYPYLADTVI